MYPTEYVHTSMFFFVSPEQWPLPTPYLETRGNKIMNATRKGLRNLSIQESIKGLRVIIRDSTLPQGHTETLSIIKGIAYV